MAAAPFISVEIEVDGEDEPREVHLPAIWQICSTCSGSGGHSRRFGAITEEDRRLNWDEDSFRDYMNGEYDEKCETCDGTGKVAVVNRDACEHHPDLKAALAYRDMLDEIDREDAAIQAAEMRFCYGL